MIIYCRDVLTCYEDKLKCPYYWSLLENRKYPTVPTAAAAAAADDDRPTDRFIDRFNFLILSLSEFAHSHFHARNLVSERQRNLARLLKKSSWRNVAYSLSL